MTTKTFAEQFEAIKGQKILMIGLLFLFVIVIFWIGLSMFSSQTKFAVPKEMRDLAKPMTPTVKDSVLTAIEQKRTFAPEELSGFTIYKIIEGKGSQNQSRLVDIGYVPVENEVDMGTVPEAKPGGLSTFLQENPNYADATVSAQPEQAAESVDVTSNESVPTGELEIPTLDTTDQTEQTPAASPSSAVATPTSAITP